MSKARKDGLYLLLLGAAMFLVLGFALENAARVSTADFRLVYYSARCLLTGHDPYRESDLQKTYLAEGGETPNDTAITRKTETQLIYPPTAFSVTLPFALLPFKAAQVLWLLVTAASMIGACFLMWELSAECAPLLAGALIGLTLANCELFLAIAGPGGIAIGLCVTAAWCFLRERFTLIGVLLFAFSLMLKPHDSALIWLCFLLAGGSYRKRAMQTLAVVLGISLPLLIWVSFLVPDWLHELKANLAANSAHGALSDPGVSSAAGHGVAMIISLQTIFSFFLDLPGFYNWSSYLMSGVLLAICFVKMIRTQTSRDGLLFALAAVAPLSMLPVYHRLDDSKVLLLMLPACSLLWHERGRFARLAVLVTAVQIFLTSAIPWAIFLALIKRVPAPQSGWETQIAIALQVLPAPLILLIAATFYLWMYLRRENGSECTPQ
jgi:hypothetical protein